MNGLENLNDLKIITKHDSSYPLKDFSLHLNEIKLKKCEIYFKNLEDALISKIHEFRKGLILGCVAWLTSSKILSALAECENVQIIVQKEDFLKPDLDSQASKDWKLRLKHQYGQLKCDLCRLDFQQPISRLQVCGDLSVDPIRCVGNHNSEKRPAFPRSHHKFLVFCRKKNWQSRIPFEPIAVWTGSFNFSFTATRSFENAIYLEAYTGTHQVMNAYLKEHHQIFSLSEALNWEEQWTTPQYSVGT